MELAVSTFNFDPSGRLAIRRTNVGRKLIYLISGIRLGAADILAVPNRGLFDIFLLALGVIARIGIHGHCIDFSKRLVPVRGRGMVLRVVLEPPLALAKAHP